jgi:hypothetical protein
MLLSEAGFTKVIFTELAAFRKGLPNRILLKSYKRFSRRYYGTDRRGLHILRTERVNTIPIYDTVNTNTALISPCTPQKVILRGPQESANICRTTSDLCWYKPLLPFGWERIMWENWADELLYQAPWPQCTRTESASVKGNCTAWQCIRPRLVVRCWRPFSHSLWLRMQAV